MSKIPVMEIFGPTIQGEGAVIGQKTMFVRTAGCDYACSWCDSSFTWDGSGKHLIKQMNADEIWEELQKIGGNGFSFVTISGGNPALLKNLNEFVRLLKDKGMKVALETQGSKFQEWFYNIDELTISPKPPSSGMEPDFAMLDEILQKTNKQSVSLKIVVFTDEDYQFGKKIHSLYPEIPFYLQAGNEYIQLENNSLLLEKLLDKYRWLIEKVLNDDEMKNVRVLPQLHTYVWGNKQGV